MENLTKIDFLYGTAWKEELTEECVAQALRAGYRAIDTANQRKHYYEEGVGLALSRAAAELGIKRSELFLQTKFTYARGQDHRKPYDESADFKTQVRQSFDSSLQHLKTDYLDSYILHGPSGSGSLTNTDWEVWQTMEDLQRSGKTKFIGISNVTFDQLLELYESAKLKPSFVQNRCFAETRWDKTIRDFCRNKGIAYQGFSLLTANSKFLGGVATQPKGRNVPQLVLAKDSTSLLHKDVQKILVDTGKNISQVIFRFAQQVEMIPLTGTRSVEHVKSNLSIENFVLSESQIETLESIAFLK